jgi:hypothetical protein
MTFVRFEVLTASMKFRLFWDVVSEWTNVSEVHTASIIRMINHLFIIALMMEAVSTSETSVHSSETTQCYIPGDSTLQV